MWTKQLEQWAWLAPVLLALLVNLNVLQNGLGGWDDENIIPNLRPPDRWMSFFLPDPAAASKQAFPYYRPLVSVSYYLDYLFWGNRPFGFHLSVWLAHLLNTALVFFLARRLTAVDDAPGQTDESAQTGPGRTAVRPYPMLPLLAASLFAVHPAHAEAVAWIAGRNDVFCTAFMLSSLLLYIRFHRTENRLTFGFSMFFFLLALWTKETAVGLILLFPLYEYLAADGVSPVLWKRTAVRWAIPLAVLGVYFWMRSAPMPFLPGRPSVSPTASFATVSEIIRAYGYYFRLMLFPYPHNPYIADIPGSDSWMFITLSGLTLVLLIAAAIVALYRIELSLGVGLVWMLVLLTPAVLVAAFRIAATPLAERYLYAPSVGFVISVGWLTVRGLGWIKVEKRGFPIKSAALAALFWIGVIGAWGWESWNRNAVWRSPMTFWEASVATAPDVGLPYSNLGVQYARLGRYAEAEFLYRKAITMDEKTLGTEHPASARNLYNLANLYRNGGRYSEAELFYQKATAIWVKTLGPDDPDVAASLNNLGAVYQAQGRYAEAEAAYLRSLAIRQKVLGQDHPNVARSIHNLALLYSLQKRYAEAEVLYRQALMISERAPRPDDAQWATILESYADLLHKTQREAEAVTMEGRARMIRTKHPKAITTD